MNDIPKRREMPEALRERLWTEDIEPQLAPRHRFGSMRAPLAVAASVVVLAALVAIGFTQLRGTDTNVASGQSQLVKDCVRTTRNMPDPTSWRAAARYDLSSQLGFVVIRNSRTAAACVIENGKATGVIGGAPGSTDLYGQLTPERPFDYLTSMNYPKESIHFGITTDDVVGLSLIGPDNSVSPGVVADGTFIVRDPIGENSGQPTTNYVRATLANGQTVQGPLRN
ncbi:hypothetical protein [Kutzneria chonburiensis]|uniref:DUF4232 domain-containing protein n=1 Tax=Kutzneria chonburiensis TaxID=1483604 RepID=A0ABV6N6Q6_9PSEU|nr:hypothetical protein [Kutzneria chonburiensis]